MDGEALVKRLQAELDACGAGEDEKIAALVKQLDVAKAALLAAVAKKSAASASSGASPPSHHAPAAPPRRV